MSSCVWCPIRWNLTTTVSFHLRLRLQNNNNNITPAGAWRVLKGWGTEGWCCHPCMPAPPVRLQTQQLLSLRSHSQIRHLGPSSSQASHGASRSRSAELAALQVPASPVLPPFRHPGRPPQCQQTYQPHRPCERSLPGFGARLRNTLHGLSRTTHSRNSATASNRVRVASTSTSQRPNAT
jgi:hypothetical protein